MVDKTAHMFITGPEVIKTVTNEEVTFEELGGASTHGSRSGVSHFTAGDDEEALELARNLVDLLPSNNLEKPPLKRTSDSIDRPSEKIGEIVPSDPSKPYDVKDVISEVLDDGGFLEVQREWARILFVDLAILAAILLES